MGNLMINHYWLYYYIIYSNHQILIIFVFFPPKFSENSRVSVVKRLNAEQWAFWKLYLVFPSHCTGRYKRIYKL